MSSPSRFDDVLVRQTAAAYSRSATHYDDFYCVDASDLADSDVIFGRVRRQDPGGGWGIVTGSPHLFIDLGCGPGTALRWKVAGPDRYVGIDQAQGAIEVAWERYPEFDFIVGSERDMASNCASFILGGFGPLMHVASLPAFSREIERALVRGGRFLLMADPHGRPVRIFEEEIQTIPHSAEELRRAFAWARGLKVYGHRRFVGLWGSRRRQRWLLEAEHLLPRVDPDRSAYIVVEGTK